MLLHDLLHRAGRYHADRPAYCVGDEWRSYGEVAARVTRAASAMRRLGIASGDHVAVIAENGPFFLEVYFACSLVGLVLVPINIRLSANEVDFLLTDSAARAVFTDAACAPLVDRKDGLIHIRDDGASTDGLSWEAMCATDAGEFKQYEGGGENDPVHICYTGGTTGKPKGVMLSHRNVIASAGNKIVLGGFQRDDVWLHAAPMFHQADSWATFSFTALGARHVFMPRFDAATAVDLIERHAITGFQLVPTMILMMLEVAGVAKRDFSSVRRVLYGSAPMPLENLHRCMDVFGPVFQHIYGLTEAAGTVAATPWPPLDRETSGNKLLSCGQPIIGVGMEIRNDQDAPCLVGEIGRIAVSGANVMRGYWRRPAETADTLIEGWLDTGDLGFMDDDGFVYIVDRAKDMIISGGENIYSTEVEHALYEHRDILEAAVIGFPDPKWGEAVTAFVVRRTGTNASETEIIAHCRQSIAAYKCPKKIIFMKQLPKSGAGKIMKTELRNGLSEA
ncbi:MAG: long-chain fatty acid--CoA ligase [Rhodospirillaceae bacterium]|jgi:acyl-CoA synthetase (AMP-forming)/AMP-acid ligase II|nr:long-chain fatty acid--CoA ligase [Rhodospirillaceae bacterium]